MTLDLKIKRAAIDTTLNCLLKKRKTACQRTARNIMEIASCITHIYFSKPISDILYKQLIELLNTKENTEIKLWVFQTFHLDNENTP